MGTATSWLAVKGVLYLSGEISTSYGPRTTWTLQNWEISTQGGEISHQKTRREISTQKGEISTLSGEISTF